MPRRVNADEVRDEILSATIAIMSEQGLPKTTMRTIADRASCTTGRVTYFFGSREDIVVSALRRLRVESSRHLAAAAAGKSGLAALRSFLLATLPYASAENLQAHWRIWLTLWHESITETYASEEWDRRAEGYELLLRQHLESAKSSGELRHDLDIDVAVRMLASLVYGAGVDATLRPQRYSPEQVAMLIDTALASLVARPVADGAGQGDVAGSAVSSESLWRVDSGSPGTASRQETSRTEISR